MLYADSPVVVLRHVASVGVEADLSLAGEDLVDPATPIGSHVLGVGVARVGRVRRLKVERLHHVVGYRAGRARRR